MNKLELYQELVNIVDDEIRVVYSSGSYADIDGKIIELDDGKSKSPLDLFEDCLQPYLLIDMGFDVTKYCSLETFSLLHELGHIVNGWINPLEYKNFLDTFNGKEYPIYKIIKSYLELDDEYYATQWAYEFVKKNKNVLKRLEKEIER